MRSSFILSWLLLSAVIASISAAPKTSRIVGGQNAQIGQFPHQVSLQDEFGSHLCGGSILNERFVLTAAHCVVVGNSPAPYLPKFFRVRVGSIQRSMGGQLIKLKRIIVNNAYGNFIGDLALLELERPLTWSNYIRPIKLASEDVVNGGEVIISGWGQISLGEPHPNSLQWNTVGVLSKQECKEIFNFSIESLMCLSHELENGACSGDSGGPASHNGKLVGVASFIVGRCGSRNPDIYSSVVFHRDWILENITPKGGEVLPIVQHYL